MFLVQLRKTKPFSLVFIELFLEKLKKHKKQGANGFTYEAADLFSRK